VGRRVLHMRWWHVWGAGLLAACARVGTTYTPVKAEYKNGMNRTVSLAAVAYEGDVPALINAGGEVIGRMDGAGNGFSGHGDVQERVRRDAAERGATHIVFVAAHAEEDRTPVQYNTACKNGVCTTTQSGGFRFDRPYASYLLVRVPLANSGRLPVALRGGRPNTLAPSSPGSGGASPLPIGTTIKKARLRKQRAIEQARRHCYDETKVRMGEAMTDADEAALDAEAVTAIDAAEMRILASRPGAAEQTEAARNLAQTADPLQWYRMCVADEAASLEQTAVGHEPNSDVDLDVE
jgi:hypothetical protein